jgi:periplasmic copper chaperone A
MRTSTSLRRAAAAAAGATALVLAGALPAYAHVSVSSPDAAPGGFGKVVFRVPNETDDATTTKVQVRLPSDTPLASVSTMPVPGWTVEAEPTKLPKPVDVEGATVTEAVTSVTWTAENGGGLAPGQFGEFAISAGPFPEDAEAMSFPTTQTYSDGEVVRWNQPVEPGTPEAQEPEHPAPLLELTAGEESAGHSHGDTADTEPASATTEASGTQADGSDTVARTLGGIALVLAAAALARSLLGGRRARG